MDNNESNIHAYTDVMMKKAHLDWEMECLQTKIKCKNEENSKLEKQICERKNELEKLRKNVSASCEREEKVKNNINMLRNSRTISEGLLMSMKHQLRILEEKRNDTRNVRKNIIEKYSKLFESHAKIYSNLPWVKKINELKMSVQNRKIHLDILKLEYSSFKNKISLFNRIQEQRKVVAIIRLAKCLTTRNNLQKELESLYSKQKEFQSIIVQLEEDKTSLQERIDLKLKEALEEARGRVVKKHLGGSTGEKSLIVASSPEMATNIGKNLKQTNESIFSRLGLSVPLSMKRLLTSSSRIINRVSSTVEEQSTNKNVQGIVQEKSVISGAQKDVQTMGERVREHTQCIKEDRLKTDVAIPGKTNTSDEKSETSELRKNKQTTERKSTSISQAVKRPLTSSHNIPEKIPCTMEVIKHNKVATVENICSGQEKAQNLEEKGKVTNIEKPEVTHTTTMEFAIGKKITAKNDEIKNQDNANQTIKKKVKRKLKKDSNSDSSSVHALENPNISGNNQNVVESEESLKDNGNEAIIEPITHEKHVTFVIATEETETEDDIEPEVQVIRRNDPPPELAQEKNIMNEPEMNDSNLSILDNISVVSSTFTNENRNQLAKSPDFLNQIPQSYCFSPLYSPSKADNISEISSAKGDRSPSNNFTPASIDSPLFSMDVQPTAGHSSDFSSFFGTASSKKNENSSKNFFQLFG